MALKKTHDAVYAGEKYTDRDGNEKTRYINVGALLERDDGSRTLKLESIPVGFNGWINFFEPRDREGGDRQQRGGGSGGSRGGAPQRERPQRATEPAPMDNFSDDDIPFLTANSAW